MRISATPTVKSSKSAEFSLAKTIRRWPRWPCLLTHPLRPVWHSSLALQVKKLSQGTRVIELRLELRTRPRIERTLRGSIYAPASQVSVQVCELWATCAVWLQASGKTRLITLSSETQTMHLKVGFPFCGHFYYTHPSSSVSHSLSYFQAFYRKKLLLERNFYCFAMQQHCLAVKSPLVSRLWEDTFNAVWIWLLDCIS